MKYKVLITNMDVNYEVDWGADLDCIYQELYSCISSNIPCDFSIDSDGIGQLSVNIDDHQYNRYKLTTPLDEQYNLTDIDWLYYTISTTEEEFDGYLIETIIEWYLEWRLISD